MSQTQRKAFEIQSATPDLAQLSQATLYTCRDSSEHRGQLIAALNWVAFCAPGATEIVYDTIANAWLDGTDASPQIEGKLHEAPLTDAFWTTYWEVVDGARQGYDAASITEAVASLGGAVHESFGDIAEEVARNHPGADQPHLKTVPGFIAVDQLANCPRQSLGYELYELLTVNGFDAEVLDRNAIMLSELPPALRYLNTRILQMHDVWHLAAGYTTDAMHEVGISAFQLAQFPHNYSAMFLAVAARISHELNPRGFNIFMQTVAESWRHGRNTPSLMAIEWEEEFDKSIDEIRRQHGITPFTSRLPADLVETLSAGSLWKKLKTGIQVYQVARQIRRVGSQYASSH